MKQERYDNYKDEYKELCEIFGEKPKIDVDKLYDCEVRIEGEIEKRLRQEKARSLDILPSIPGINHFEFI